MWYLFETAVKRLSKSKSLVLRSCVFPGSFAQMSNTIDIIGIANEIVPATIKVF